LILTSSLESGFVAIENIIFLQIFTLSSILSFILSFLKFWLHITQAELLFLVLYTLAAASVAFQLFVTSSINFLCLIVRGLLCHDLSLYDFSSIGLFLFAIGFIKY